MLPMLLHHSHLSYVGEHLVATLAVFNGTHARVGSIDTQLFIGSFLISSGEEERFVLNIRRWDTNTPVVFFNGESVIWLQLLIKLLKKPSLSDDIHPYVLVEARQLLLALRLLRAVPRKEAWLDIIDCEVLKRAVVRGVFDGLLFDAVYRHFA
jgi:hypothetical protein